MLSYLKGKKQYVLELEEASISDNLVHVRLGEDGRKSINVEKHSNPVWKNCTFRVKILYVKTKKRKKRFCNGVQNLTYA